MPASIGVNLRVTGHCRQGGRKYMEDFFSVAYQQTEDEKDLEYAFFGIYDGHGGAEAAAFAKEHLMESIVKHRSFWSDDDAEVLQSIKDGFMHTHLAMWKIHNKWPKTASGLPSTAGTTASVAFIRRGKIYIGHVGDSGITLGYQEPGCTDWKAKQLTKDHKPESDAEMKRIEQSGGKVVSKSGVPRVVWNRPRIGHKGPVRRSTPIDEIPFLAVARSLGDLWSFNSALNEFVVSPLPDVSVVPVDTSTFRCLIFGTDGLYNMLSPQMAVHIVQQAEKHSEQSALSDIANKIWINPSKCLVEKALERWSNTKMRADNTSVITLMLDPPGPPRAQVLRSKRSENYSCSGLQIETRYQDKECTTEPKLGETSNTKVDSPPPTESDVSTDLSKIETDLEFEKSEKFVPKPRESTAFSTRPQEEEYKNENDIQINEISSSNIDYSEEEASSCKSNKVETRKINLRSSNVKEKDVTSSKNSSFKRKLEPGPEPTSECRVLRERKICNTIQKKKSFVKSKLNLNSDKKKLLQNVLFRQKDPTNKTWELRDARKSLTPSKCENTKDLRLRNSDRLIDRSDKKLRDEKKKCPTPPPSLAKCSTSRKEGKTRKSTLAQKLFKAKLRGRTITKKLTKEKVMRLRNSVSKRS